MSEQIEVLKDIRKWLRFIGVSELDRSLHTILDTEDKKRVYDMADGDTSQTNIIDKTGVPRSTVSDWLREWKKIGIVEKNGSKYEHLIGLEHIDLNGGGGRLVKATTRR